MLVPMRGLVEADAVVVGLVIVAVCIAAVAYVVGRLRGRGPGPSGRGG
jgi:hypothetical protein